MRGQFGTLNLLKDPIEIVAILSRWSLIWYVSVDVPTAKSDAQCQSDMSLIYLLLELV
jgi:hypothetical protein